MEQILSLFPLPADVVLCERYGNGHINETYRVICANNEAFILQKINTGIFRDPAALMQNIRLVTDHLARVASERREVLRLVLTRNNEAYADVNGEAWRMYEFVAGSVCLERAESPAQYAESAIAFARFMNQLADFDASRLSEVIPSFHDTPRRVEALKKAIAADPLGRVKEVGPEIDAALMQESFAHTFADLQAAGELPLRVTHNDTKINNVLFDERTLRGLCVIDLDTVMPGLIMNDFGDSIRFGANTAAEDERDLSRVQLDLALYETYLTAYLAICGRSLTKTEIAMLPAGAKMMTYECGVRFLTDYLEGDVYFRIHCPDHNLVRARTQLTLVSRMDEHWDNMQTILKGAQNV